MMILTGLTFTFIKLSILFFYRRLFRIHHNWLGIAWWANIVCVILWLITSSSVGPSNGTICSTTGNSTGHPAIHGQCNATSTIHVTIPLIFGLFSDVMVLTLSTVSIFRLRVSSKSGLALVLSVGII
jgi:hypothetical protein